MVMDGDPKLEQAARREAKRRGVKLTLVLDFIHALEYLWRAGHALHAEGSPELETWVLDRLTALLHGNVSNVAAGMRRSATRRGLSASARAPIDRAANYFLKRKSMMRYHDLLALGAPIASGVVEGTCRSLVNDRLDITGARWSVSGAEAVLRLRAILRSADWDEYWASGPVYGQLAGLLVLAREIGIERALGASREGRLALFLVLARIAHRGSRLSAVRWAQTQAVKQALGLEAFDEDDLYEALNWLEREQERIEQELAPKGSRGAVFLYDVTSSYLEGHHNELAAAGHNRDGKKYKKQIVAGLLTDAKGEPVSVQVYEGNTADPKTVADQVEKLVTVFGAKEAVLVGDRGMIRTKGKELLTAHGFKYVTSLTDPEVRRLLSMGVLQLEMFDERVTEVTTPEGIRYVLRRNPTMVARTRDRRADQLRRVQQKVEERNRSVADKPRADPNVSLLQANRWLRTYHLTSFVQAVLDGREVRLQIDEARRDQVERLDGCYVVTSNVSPECADAQVLWDRYGGLQQVERDFRTIKTTLLEIRPIFLRKANRTRAHALVAMQALRIARELQRRVAPADLTCEDALDRLGGVRLVSLADPSLGLWRLPARWNEPERLILSLLPPLPPPLLSQADAH
jgi:hypothetical protein